MPRYQTMRGHRVERRFGWDTHGLPAELEAQRLLGITDTSQIEEMGLAAFNQACRESVLRYTGEWREYVTRQARWVDFDARLQDARRDVHGVGHLGVQAPLRPGHGVRGLPRAAVLLARRDPAVQPRAADGRRRLPVAPGPRADGRPAAGDRRAGPHLDDDPVDAAEQPGDRGRAGRRLRDRRAGAGKPSAGRARGARGRTPGRVRQGARRGHGRRDRQGPRPRRPPLHAAVRLLRRPRERPPGAARRLRDHRGRLGHRAPGARVR